jgi:hypothetical protein
MTPAALFSPFVKTQQDWHRGIASRIRHLRQELRMREWNAGRIGLRAPGGLHS